MPDTAVIILNWNGLAYLKTCLDSVFNQTYKNFIVYFVDNGSSDGSVDFVKKNYGSKILSGKLRIIALEKNYGFAEGNNIAMREALQNKSIKYICLLNNDTRVDKRWLKELVSFAKKHPAGGIFGSKIYFLDKPKIISNIGGKMNFWLGLGWRIGCNAVDKSKYDKPTKVDNVAGASMLIKKETLERIGLFPSEFFIYYEDTDLCAHAKKAGFEVWSVPRSRLWHKEGGSSTADKLFFSNRNHVWFMKRNATKLQFLFFSFVWLTIGLFIRCLIHGNWKAQIRGFLTGLIKPAPKLNLI